MNKDQYLRMMEQTGEEIDWDRCPPDWEDFPDSVTTAIELFYELGDRVYSEVGFVGKDFTNLDILCKHLPKGHFSYTCLNLEHSYPLYKLVTICF